MIGSVTCNRTLSGRVMVLASVNTGGRSLACACSPASGRPRNTANSTNVGTAMASSLAQYWNACTRVIARIPPPSTFTTTTALTTAVPTQVGSLVAVVRVSPALCSCGTR